MDVKGERFPPGGKLPKSTSNLVSTELLATLTLVSLASIDLVWRDGDTSD
jgi:hypothetical protein